jgi:hypothetical protein
MVVSRVVGLNRIAMSGRSFPLSVPNLRGLYLAGPAWCYSDDAGTTPSTVGGVVATWKDAAGGSLQLNQTVNGQRPLLQQTAGGKYYVAFDGSDDFYTFSGSFLSIPLTAHGAVRLTGTLAAKVDPLFSGANGAQKLKVNDSATGMVGGKEGTVNWTASSAALVSGTDAVGGLSYGSTGAAVYWKDGVTAGTALADVSTSNFTANVSRVGANNANSEWFQGRVYGLAFYNAGLSDADNTGVQRYLATLF